MEGGEHFSLCWNNFHSNLSSGFNSLFKDEDLVDVTLAAGGRFLKAHKTVLSVCSSFFKDLFRANPNNHPIVILPDVNYNALCALMQFIYQGEVSVSQEEIPAFMKIAEMLKVKGLTESSPSGSTSSSESNGYSGPSYTPEMRPLKRAPPPPQQQRVIKKPTKPNTPPVSYSDHPRFSSAKSPHPPPPKRLQIENIKSGVIEQEFPQALVMPKKEPVDDESDASGGRFTEEHSVDLSGMVLERKRSGESSQWNESEDDRMMDSSTPGGGLMLIKSGRGQLVLIHEGHIYIHCDTQSNRHRWVCVKKKTLNCEGALTTLNGPILLSYSAHNHPQLQDVIQRLQVPSSSVSPELT